MPDFNVENVNWNPSSVVIAGETEKSFCDKHMSDVGTYAGMPQEKKLASLKLAWKLCGGKPYVETKVQPVVAVKE